MEEGEGVGGERERSEKSSKTDSESQSSEDDSSSSDDSSPSTNHNPTSGHMTKPVAEEEEEAESVRLAAGIAELAVYDPSYPELALTTALDILSEIVSMRDRLHVARLIQQVSHTLTTVTVM